jgi:hypothetical protein
MVEFVCCGTTSHSETIIIKNLIILDVYINLKVLIGCEL